MSGSPIAPRAIPKTVIPTWTVEMNRTGSSIVSSAVRAARFPSSARSSSRVRRAVTSAYSAATKIALRSTSSEHDEDARHVTHRAPLRKVVAPLPGARVLGGSSPSTQAEV